MRIIKSHSYHDVPLPEGAREWVPNFDPSFNETGPDEEGLSGKIQKYNLKGREKLPEKVVRRNRSISSVIFFVF